MSVKEVLLLGNPKLREKSSNVKKFDDEFEINLKNLSETLSHLQKEKQIGRAIAAPQIGWMKNVIFYNLPERAFSMINPRILWKSETMIEVWDSCFCFDVAFFIEIERYKEIQVQYLDKRGNKKIEKFADDLSELVQHEIDHLNGILATDHLKNPHKIIMRNEWERRFK
ncbi:MAG: peptide deformylase [Candidatus Hermodarchaeota archaeon]